MAEKKQGAVQQISESSTVRLGLAITMLAGVVWLVNSMNGIRNDIDSRYVSKEVFTARLDEIVRGMGDLKSEFRQLREEVRAIQATVSSTNAQNR